MENIGWIGASLVLVFLGIFAMIAAYSREPLLLKIATLGTFKIDPDNPGTTARAVMFTLGACLIVFAVLLLVVERLADLGIMGAS